MGGVPGFIIMRLSSRHIRDASGQINDIFVFLAFCVWRHPGLASGFVFALIKAEIHHWICRYPEAFADGADNAIADWRIPVFSDSG